MDTTPAVGPSLGPKAFGKKHNVSRTTIYNEIKSGRLKAKKLGGRTIITAEDERAWLDSLPVLEVISDAEALENALDDSIPLGVDNEKAADDTGLPEIIDGTGRRRHFS